MRMFRLACDDAAIEGADDFARLAFASLLRYQEKNGKRCKQDSGSLVDGLGSALPIAL